MFKVAVFTVLYFASAQLAASSPEVLSRYRNVSLGDALSVVVQRLDIAAADVKVISANPALVQEVSWRPHRFISGSTVRADPLGELVLTFHHGRLVRIVANYDRDRTAGLTEDDFRELFSGVYGLALLPSATPAAAAASASGAYTERRTLSSWQDAETSVTLWQEQYPRRVGLTITSLSDDHDLRMSLIEAARLDAQSAPDRERAIQAAAATAIKQRDAEIRRENKANFKP
jgi:hypothetical protein